MRDDKLYTDYVLEKDAEMVYNTGIYRAEERGRAEGRMEGLKVAARTMLADHEDDEKIMKYTGLSIDEIESIKASL